MGGDRGRGCVGGYMSLLVPPLPGIDLTDMASEILQPHGDDVARISWYLRSLVSRYQETFNVIEKVLWGAGRAPPQPCPSLLDQP